MKWIDYREKLGISHNDQEKYVMLKNKIQVYIEQLGRLYSEDCYREYCIMVGEPLLNYGILPIYGLVRSLVEETHSSFDLISKYIAFYNTFDEPKEIEMYKTPAIKPQLLSFIQESLRNLSIQYELVEDNDGIFIFPKGVPEYDDELVSFPLKWLSRYPVAEVAWSKALRAYSESSAQNASDVADLFRKALEAFFQEFYQSNKSLENYKAEYGNYLKQKGIPKEISGNLETLLQAYTNYINSFAKHRDATSNKILEYLMYQTGNIMRLLITL